MASSKESATRELGGSFAEFFRAMHLLSGNENQAMAKPFGVHPSAYGNWVLGHRIPSRRFDDRIKELFGLTQAGVDGLRLGSEAQRRQEQAEAVVDDTTMSGRFLGALAIRARTGPPLTLPEVELIKFLLIIEQPGGTE